MNETDDQRLLVGHETCASCESPQSEHCPECDACPDDHAYYCSR